MTTLFKFQENQKYYFPELPEDITAIAAYGRTLNYGEAFTYLYRRFGHSPERRDSYKDLAIYYLSTPLESVALAVFPHHESYPFKCLANSDTRDKLYQERKIITDKFEERFKTWHRENNDNVENLSELTGDFHKEVQSALITTIKDLLTPVNIRDWGINILGKI